MVSAYSDPSTALLPRAAVTREPRSFLIVGYRRPGALELAYARALARQQLPVVDHFDIEAPETLLARHRLAARLTERLRCHLAGGSLFRFLRRSPGRYEAIVVVKGMTLTRGWLARCRKVTPAATWINLNPDDPFGDPAAGTTNRHVRGSIRDFDLYVTWSPRLVPALQAAGCAHVLALPFGYDAEAHFRPTALCAELEDVVTFVGAWDRRREQLLTEVADFPIRIYGQDWDRVRHGSPLRGKVCPGNLFGAALRSVVASSRASLNILRPQNTGSHNMRTFEIPAMGGLMLTTASEEQARFFPPGEASLDYRDASDLREKLRQVLQGGIDARHLKESAMALCHRQDYDARARTLCRAVARHRGEGGQA